MFMGFNNLWNRAIHNEFKIVIVKDIRDYSFLGIENKKPFFAQSLNFCKSSFKIDSIWCLPADE